jgi:hypothetical protein
MLSKKIFAGSMRNIDSERGSKAQVRFKTPTPMIRLLRSSRMPATFSTASVMGGRSDSVTGTSGVTSTADVPRRGVTTPASGQIRTNPPGRVLLRTRWRNLKLRPSRTADLAPLEDHVRCRRSRVDTHHTLGKALAAFEAALRPPFPTVSTANSAKRRLNLAEHLVARRASQSKRPTNRAAAFVCWRPARRHTPDAGACARSKRGLRRSYRADIRACPCRRIPK